MNTNDSANSPHAADTVSSQSEHDHAISTLSRGKLTFHFAVLQSPDKPKIAHVKRNDLVEAVLRMLTISSKPLTMVNDDWFRQIVLPYEKALNLRVNYPFIVNIIKEAYEELLPSWKKYWKTSYNLFVTRLDRSFIGINTQFVCKGKMIIVTLGVIQLEERHTGQYLKNAILSELWKLEVHIEQLYTLTTDNGADLCRAAKLIEEKSQLKSTEREEPESDDSDLLWDDNAEYEGSDKHISDVLDGPIDLITDASELLKDIENVQWMDNVIKSKYV